MNYRAKRRIPSSILVQRILQPDKRSNFEGWVVDISNKYITTLEIM